MKISEKVVSVINGDVEENGYGKEISTAMFHEMLIERFPEINPKSIQPSDYCYNMYNAGLQIFDNGERCLKCVGVGQFKILGTGYEYSGPVYQYMNKSNETIVGKWEDGRYYPINNNCKGYEQQKFDNEIKEMDAINSLPQLSGVDKMIITKARINQSEFRNRLITKYHHCCLCGIESPSLLVASHIKPWSEANEKERLDVNNGLLLCANHDKLFDQHLIAFDENGNIMISRYLSENDKIFSNVHDKMRLQIDAQMVSYMEYHRKVFEELN